MPDSKPIRKGYSDTEPLIREGERAVIATITTAAIDRDQEVIMPKGIDFTSYRKNPTVLWAHDSYAQPIGKNQWIKRDGAVGLLAKTIFADTPFASEVFRLVQGGFVNAVSIGFMPKEWREPTEKERGQADWSNVRRIFTSVELLEYSFVPVPSNPEALVTAVSKGALRLSDRMHDFLKVDDLTRQQKRYDIQADIKPVSVMYEVLPA